MRASLASRVTAGVEAFVRGRATAPGRLDPLTGAATRTAALERLQHAVDVAQRSGRKVAVLFVDLDGFKELNDRHQHAAGDEVLRQVATRLGRAGRRTDLVCRWGGDEFVLVVEHVDGVAGAAVVADRVLAALRRPVHVGDATARVTASVGVALAPDASTVPDELVRLADAAMYDAKAAGGDTARFSTDELRRGQAVRQATLRDLREALAAGHLRLAVQPEVELATGRVAAAEALLRWERRDHDPVAASRFIALTETSELAEPLGRWVLRSACAEAARWAATGADEVAVAVNVGARHLRSDALVPDVVDALERSGLPAHLLRLEVAEVDLAGAVPRAGRTLDALADLGVRLVVDRFGVGGLPLATLAALRVAAVKPDAAVVATLDEPAGALAAVVGLAHRLGIEVTVPLLEDADAVRRARRLGCDRVQGWAVAPPVPAAELPGGSPVRVIDVAALEAMAD